MKHQSLPAGVSRQALVDWFREGRQRTKEIFAIPTADAYYDRPIPLRNPIVFYEGHLPAFSINTLIKLAFQREGIDEQFEVLFARGIDPDSPDAVKDPASVWPARANVLAYGVTADALLEHALMHGEIEDDRVPQLRGGEAALAILEHEQMHQETLLYMLHNMPYERKNARHPLVDAPERRLTAAGRGSVSISAGSVTLGADRAEDPFGWDHEYPKQRVGGDAFAIDRCHVTYAD